MKVYIPHSIPISLPKVNQNERQPIKETPNFVKLKWIRPLYWGLFGLFGLLLGTYFRMTGTVIGAGIGLIGGELLYRIKASVEL